MDVRGGTWLVIGLARSGCAAGALLRRRGARVVGADDAGEAALTAQWQRHGLAGEAREAFDEVRSGPGWETALPRLAGVVLSPGVPAARAAAAAPGVPVLGELELAARFFAGRAVAITGTNGKTTTTELTAHLLRAAGYEAPALGNVGRPLSRVADSLGPDAVAVVEVSSFQLESVALPARGRRGAEPGARPPRPLRVRGGVLRRQAAARGSAAPRGAVRDRDRLPAGPGLARAASPAVRRPGSGSGLLRARRPTVAPARRRTAGGAGARGLSPPRRTECPQRRRRPRRPRTLRPGRRRAGGGLRSFRGLPHRQQEIARGEGLVFVDDSKATNVHAVCGGLAGYAGDVVLILGGSGKGEDYAPLREALGPVRAAVLIGAEADRIAAALAGTVPLVRAADLDGAVAAAAGLLPGGGTVLLSPACASFDMFRDYHHRGEEFQAAARRWLDGRAGAAPLREEP
ncbi:MAG: UDP-N-acetylmuramoyl-L-alanine--D-glutamate ligase [bacterium]|nr:UDP-N-acetylmuramoyl-L-alanine--D-glutamate ligase [bacterium]